MPGFSRICPAPAHLALISVEEYKPIPSGGASGCLRLKVTHFKSYYLYLTQQTVSCGVALKITRNKYKVDKDKRHPNFHTKRKKHYKIIVILKSK